MDYFGRLAALLQEERTADRTAFEALLANRPAAERREAGITWYPVALRDTEIGRGDYLTIDIERTTHHDLPHQFRAGTGAALFSNHSPGTDRVEGIITHLSGNRLKLSLRIDELPDWARRGKLGVDALFDQNSYEEMEAALKTAASRLEKGEAALPRIILGQKKPVFYPHTTPPPAFTLNTTQQAAVQKILSAQELAIVHGPPGTGKTTTLVAAIKALREKGTPQILVTAPSNAAVDLLTEKLADSGLNVVRAGNPARVNEKQLALTLETKILTHPAAKELKRLKKQAAEYRDLAQKYKRNFGAAEREQRKALFAEARAISAAIEKTEEYIAGEVLEKADVITATLVGSSHRSIRNRKYGAVVVDEAGQALEPACWIPVLKSPKLVMAGDHHQLPPTIKSAGAAKELSVTLLQKLVALHPEAVVMLEEQYRMNAVIMAFSSGQFYDGRLRANKLVSDRLLFPDDDPLLFIDTAGCGFEENREGASIFNPEEGAFLLKHLNRFLADHATLVSEQKPSIAVISPYRRQVELLQGAAPEYPAIAAAAARLSINTIDSFQGQERDVVYISLSRSNTDSTIGFLSEVRRMNVAMTRARKKLVVVGDSATLSGVPFYADFIAYAQQVNGYASAWEWMD